LPKAKKRHSIGEVREVLEVPKILEVLEVPKILEVFKVPKVGSNK